MLPTKILNFFAQLYIFGITEYIIYIFVAYLRAENVNIIAVDWYPLSQLFYLLARSAVSPIGYYTASFVDFLVLDVGVTSNSIHVVGHSLGAHIAGVVGENVTFGNLSRITGK